ncbi:MAG: 30S ribosome-binding factor RbfA [Planctomycetes bacterium]|nr:30S ribosome-binding factor RbfA [Planctomycetota bacterium]
MAHLIRTVLADALQQKLSDPRIEPMTSITRVEMSPDLSSAHVHVSVMADEPRRKRTLEALQHASGRLRAVLADHLTLRIVPWLTFHLDDSLRRGFETVQTLDRLMQEAGPSGAPGDPGETRDDPDQPLATQEES